MSRCLYAVVTCFVLGVSARVQAEEVEHAVQRDRTGIRWVLPFGNALREARHGNRLLMIKPVAFGTDASGGW